MLVKGKLVGNCSKVTPEIQVEVSEEELQEKGWYNHGYSPVIPLEKVEEIKQEFLQELLSATIKHVVCPEYLRLFEDVDEWHDYVGMLLNDPEQLLKDFASGSIQNMIEERAEEVYQDNKPQYYPVDVTITTNVRIYVKARSEDEVDDAMNYNLTASEIIDEVSFADYETEDFWIGAPIDEEYVKYDSIYDVEEESFI